MNAIRVDPAARTASVQAGALWGTFDREAQAFGLATTGGTVSNTGVAGLTLGGGLGWLMGAIGLSCDNLLSADVVTADGRFLKASATEHEDLFWGIRGGGGNFGIVTTFDFRLHRLDRWSSAEWSYILWPARKMFCGFIRRSCRRCPTRPKPTRRS